jgi:hypothetical protein
MREAILEASCLLGRLDQVLDTLREGVLIDRYWYSSTSRMVSSTTRRNTSFGHHRDGSRGGIRQSRRTSRSRRLLVAPIIGPHQIS